MTMRADDEFLHAGFPYVLKSTDLKTTLTNLVKAAAQAVGSGSGTLFLLDKEKGMLEPYVLVNVPEKYLADAAACGWAISAAGGRPCTKRPGW